MDKLYKVLDKDGKGPYSGVAWSLPHDGQPGDWMPPVEGELVLCKNGYHLCTRDQIVERLGARLFEAEYRGDGLCTNDEVVMREARLLREITAWNDRVRQLFACDCAEHVLPFLEQKYPDDERARHSIEMARRFANGDATKEELDTARAAAWEAAWAILENIDVTELTTRADAWAARAAAWDPIRDSAWPRVAACAGDFARESVTASEKHWQTERLFEYLEGKHG